MAAVADKAARAADGTVHATVRLAKGLPIDRSQPVCEIGCGYGTSLRQLAVGRFHASRRHRSVAASRRNRVGRGFDV